MAYVVKPSIHIREVPDTQLAQYVAAGWVQATAGQIEQFKDADPYLGRQGFKPAPPIVKGAVPDPGIIID